MPSRAMRAVLLFVLGSLLFVVLPPGVHGFNSSLGVNAFYSLYAPLGSGALSTFHAASLVGPQGEELQAPDHNLVQNPGFEQGSSEVPETWETNRWQQEEGISEFGVSQDDAHAGNRAAWIESSQPDHAKWVQSIPVEPSSYYVISGWIKVLRLGDGVIGANLFPLGVGGIFPHINESSSEWKKVQFYGITGPQQKELNIAAAIGGYGRLNSGKALFDDVSVERIDYLPEGASLLPLDTSMDLQLQSVADGGSGGVAAGDGELADEAEAAGDAANIAAAEGREQVPVLPIMMWSAAFSLLFAWLYQKMIRQSHPLDRRNFYEHWIGVALAAGFLLRIWIGLTVRGYETDMNTFMGWAQHAVARGLAGFYTEGIFADYPPGYIYVLYILGLIRDWFGWDFGTPGAMLLFKLPAIVADIVAGYLVYRAAHHKFGSKLGLALSMLYLFNPAVIVNSAGWGQADAFYVLFLISSLTALSERRLERSAIWFAIAAIIKPQTFIFTPVWLLALIYFRSWRRTAVSLLLGAAVFSLLALPFFWNNGGVSGLIDLYKTTLASYPYASVNAFNLYALFGHNWAPLDHRWLLLSFRTWGTLFILGAVAYACYIFLRKRGRDLSKLYFIALSLIAIMFVLGTKMHERYMFPALLLCLFSFIQSRDRRLLYVFLGFSLTQFINVAYVLGYLNLGTSPDDDGILLLCSLTNVCLLVYMLYLGFQIYVRRRRLPIKPRDEEEREASDALLLKGLRPPSSGEADQHIRLQKKDWLWIGLVTALYTIVALFQLGSARAPATEWRPGAPTSFYVDFGEVKAVERVNYFGGVSVGKLRLDFGNTPYEWGEPVNLEGEVGDVFAWKSQPIETEARYARITVDEAGLSLHEMAFYEAGSRRLIPITGIFDDAGETMAVEEYASLFDEPSTASYSPSFLNSTYFDEIYHARTAYEYWQQLPPYETTHPPLGKLLIGAGIQLFGLNPLGWRIVGTLFGAAMLPLIYRFALQLFSQRKFAVMAIVLIAAEFMHFAQTRIATIDVYAVFFILLMFYWMNRYLRMSFFKQPLGRTFVPLFWAGLFFGIGISAKWIVLYGGAGLAVMLAISLFTRYREYAAVKRKLSAAGENEQTEYSDLYLDIESTFARKIILTLSSCIIFFVLIPALIYTISYIPALTATEEGFTIGSLIQAQKDMFDYHSGLVGSHPFASSWWEWPLMKRPVWFYSAQGEADGLASGIVSSIVTIGNPLIWWSGILAMAATFWLSIKCRDQGKYVIWIAFLAQYVPWMLVTRETFLYHYFAMVPFLIAAIVYVASFAEKKWPKFKPIRYAYLGAAVALFIMFYPVLSGMEVNADYVKYVLKWFPTWVF